MGEMVVINYFLVYCKRISFHLQIILRYHTLAGKSNGKGYYIYEKGSKPRPDPSVLPIIEESRRITNIMPGGKVHSRSY